MNGRGVPQDNTLAAQWYLRAAEQGELIAQYGLGVLYRKGLGVSKSYIYAYMWFDVVVLNTSEDLRDIAIKARDTLSKEMSNSDVSIAHNLARECILKELKKCS